MKYWTAWFRFFDRMLAPCPLGDTWVQEDCRQWDDVLPAGVYDVS